MEWTYYKNSLPAIFLSSSLKSLFSSESLGVITIILNLSTFGVTVDIALLKQNVYTPAEDAANRNLGDG